eukprot:m.76035 g.76035  ORF g.76035 m.76035 type:complete len:276 (+) comp24851_c0_seq1:365-1192(+)
MVLVHNPIFLAATRQQIYTNNGASYVTRNTINGFCSNIRFDTTMVEVKMGDVHDFFRPIQGVSWCGMLTSENKHEYYNGTDWIRPNYYAGGHFGGGTLPKDARTDGDVRPYVSIWGFGDARGATGGCCAYRVQTPGLETVHWSRAFTMYAVQHTQGPTVSPSSIPSSHHIQHQAFLHSAQQFPLRHFQQPPLRHDHQLLLRHDHQSLPHFISNHQSLQSQRLHLNQSYWLLQPWYMYRHLHSTPLLVLRQLTTQPYSQLVFKPHLNPKHPQLYFL